LFYNIVSTKQLYVVSAYIPYNISTHETTFIQL